MPSDKTKQNNMLSSGYLREYENDNKVIVPNVIQDIVANYCKVCNVYSIGSNSIPNDTSSQYHILPSVNKLIRQSDDLVVNGYGTNIKHKQNELVITSNNLNCSKNTDFNLIKLSNLHSISVMSSGVSNNTELYIYTTNGNLYKSDVDSRNKNKLNNTFKKIDTSFLNVNDKIIDIKCGLTHTLFLTELGNVYTNGMNDVGQCGFDKYKYAKISTPKLAINYTDHKIISIACGAFHSLALNSDNQLICFGYNCVGQLGVNVIAQNNSEVSDDETDLSSGQGDETVFGSDNSDELDIEEDNDDIFGFIDISDDESEEQKNAMLSAIDRPIINDYFNDLNIQIIKIFAGKHHTLCISNNGKAYTFGQNIFGNLGNGETTGYGISNSIPYEINNKFGFIIDGSCGENHNLLLNKKNEIICFGNNSKKQCTKINETKIMTPIFLSKTKEFGLNNNSFIEKVTCLKNESLIFIDVYRRCQLTGNKY